LYIILKRREKVQARKENINGQVKPPNPPDGGHFFERRETLRMGGGGGGKEPKAVNATRL